MEKKTYPFKMFFTLIIPHKKSFKKNCPFKPQF